MIRIKKNTILLCILILSVAIAGIHSEILGENGFKVLIEDTTDVPKKFHPDSLAKYRGKSWKDIADSAHKNNSKFFTKKAGVTTVKINNNKTVQLVDKTFDDLDERIEETIVYNYMLFISEIDSHLVVRGFYEGGDHILVSNKTGAIESIWNGIPGISPEKNRFAIASKDLIAQYSPNGIQIFEIVSGNYIKQFQQEFDWGPDNIRWLSNDTFIVDKYILDADGMEKLAGQVTVKLVAGKWILE